MKVLASPAYINRDFNPYNALLYAALEKQGAEIEEYSHARLLMKRYDVLHYHWPDGYINHPFLPKAIWRMGVLSAALFICALRKTAIVWTVHNLMPHDARHPRLARKFLLFFAGRCRGLIFPSRYSRDEFIQFYPLKGRMPFHAITSLGHYRPVYPPKMERGEARRLLGIPEEAKLILSFGSIRPYKNIEGLLDAYSAVNDPAIHLLVAGNASDPVVRSGMEKAAYADRRIHLNLQFIRAEDIPLYMGAADLAVLSYKKILNSGTLMLFFSYSLPVLAPSLGSLAELQEEAGKEWLFLYEGELSGDLIQAAISNATHMQGRIFDMKPYEWDGIALKTLELYKKASQK